MKWYLFFYQWELIRRTNFVTLQFDTMHCGAIKKYEKNMTMCIIEMYDQNSTEYVRYAVSLSVVHVKHIVTIITLH